MTTIKPSYGVAAPITCTTTALASAAALLAGRQSDQVDNSVALAVDAMLGGTIATTGTPTAGTVIEVWLWASWNGGTTRTLGFGVSDATRSAANQGEKSLMAMAAVINQDDATARTYSFGPISVAQKFGGTMPSRWGVWIVHNTGTTLGATALEYEPVQYTNA